MTIEKCIDHLRITSIIYFDDEIYFCSRPYIVLVAYKNKTDYGWDTNINYGWNSNEIGIAIRDNDDFDIGLIYKTDSEHFLNVLHELTNWMHDHEQGMSCFSDIWKPFEFFPDCGCEREIW